MEFIDLKSQYHILKKEIDSRIQAVLDHGQYILGPEVIELEEKLCEYVGSKYCITVSSGTEALIISLMSIGVGYGDEVITTPFSFAATPEAISLLGATPVFVDVESETGNIDATLIVEKITEKTKAIIPVSLYGQPSDMTAINAIASSYGLVVIEDGAQSFGSTFTVEDGIKQKSCNLSEIGCTSFFPSKPLGCYGDAGAIFTNNQRIAELCSQIRVHGQTKKYHHERLGVGGRMDTIQAAILLAKLENFPSELISRQRIAATYDGYFQKLDIKKIKPMSIKKGRSSSYGLYTILAKDRNGLSAELQKSGIPTSVHYPLPLNQQPAFKEITRDACFPNADMLSQQVLSLPLHPYISDGEQEYVVQEILKYYDGN
jgi:UDP-2-acetamido-2-deoxy-ribo-hexuluronate aminotransferase